MKKKEHTKREWKFKEDNYLINMYPKRSNKVKDIAQHLGRTQQAVYLRAQVLGLQRNPVTYRDRMVKLSNRESEDLDWKIYNYRQQNYSTSEIGEQVGMTKGQVQHRMYSKGLHLHKPEGPAPEWFNK